MAIDFLSADNDNVGATTIVLYSCPAHQVSGSYVATLNANDLVGFKMRSSADAGASAEIRINTATVTLTRLY